MSSAALGIHPLVDALAERIRQCWQGLPELAPLAVDPELEAISGSLDGEDLFIRNELRQCRGLNHILGLFASQETDATGINNGEGMPLPFHLRHDAIPRHARLIVDNRNAPAGNPVEQGGLAHVWATDNGNKARHGPTLAHG